MISDIYKGDTLEFECDAGINIINWKIRAELFDDDAHSIKKATVNSGGANDQIQITEASTGLFTLYIEKGQTTDFNNQAYLEIELEADTGEIYTGFKDTVKFKSEKITWSTP